jgi:hypothetical protein
VVQSGLVDEPAPGRFIRAAVKDRAVLHAVKSQENEPMPTPNPSASPRTASPLERLSSLADRVRAVSTEVTAIAADIETLAIELEDQIAANAEDLEIVRSMKKLFTKGAA